MRIRHKPWAKPELEACPFYVHEPQQQIGHWRELFEHPERPLYVELGCGKGGFISQAAPAHRDVNFVAMDIKNEMLVLAKESLKRLTGNWMRLPTMSALPFRISSVWNLHGTRMTVPTGSTSISAIRGPRKSIKSAGLRTQDSF